MYAVRPILAAAVLSALLGLLLELTIPGSGHIIAIGAAVCSIATWDVPPLGLALFWYRDRAVKWRPSLVGVGHTILLVILAAGLSAIGLSLALLTFVFAQGAGWAWLAILAIAAFWISLAVLTNGGGGRSARRRST